jgi:alpha-glucosidase
LPQPPGWARLARDQQPVPQEGAEFPDTTNTLSLYSRALELRHQNGFGSGSIEWLGGYGDDAIAFTVTAKSTVTVISNLGKAALPLPDGTPLVFSERPWLREPLAQLPPNTTIWLTEVG